MKNAHLISILITRAYGAVKICRRLQCTARKRRRDIRGLEVPAAPQSADSLSFFAVGFRAYGLTARLVVRKVLVKLIQDDILKS
jgi:hypothetical protein